MQMERDVLKNIGLSILQEFILFVADNEYKYRRNINNDYLMRP